MIYNQDRAGWHAQFEQFCNEQDIDAHHKTPFFWWLMDNGYRDKEADAETLTTELAAFLANQTDIVY